MVSMELIKKKCPYCDRIIEGTTIEQVDANLKSHMVFKHSDKIKFYNGEDGKLNS